MSVSLVAFETVHSPHLRSLTQPGNVTNASFQFNRVFDALSKLDTGGHS